MKRITLFFAILFMAFWTFGQSVTLTFTGRDANNQFIQLSRVVIVNATQSWQETIYYPDTTLTMGQVGIEDYDFENGLALQQNNPNPFEGITYANLRTVEPGDVSMVLTDVNGRIVETQNFASLQPGIHQFRINVSAAGIYFLTIRQNGQKSSIKMVSNGQGSTNRIEYQDFACLQKKNAKGTTNKPFNIGDEMNYTGYVTVDGTEYQSQMIHQNQFVSENFVLNFDLSSSIDGQPCPSTATVTDYDGNTYNTVQIGQQCWMKENLKTTHYSDGTSISLGSSTSLTTAYRYYPNDDSSNVATYGYLYNWLAVMQNSSSGSANSSGVQGICPTGWHVPSDAEWTQLTDYVSSQSQYVCGSNSTYIAKALASTTGWSSSTSTCAVGNTPSNNNVTGFFAVPAGNYFGSYNNFGYTACFWSATQYNSSYAYNRELNYDTAGVVRYDCNKRYGFSVRCLRDAGSSASLPTVTTTSVTSITQNSATSGGNVTADGGATVTPRGVCWSTSQNPTVSNSHTTNGSGTGSFTSSITGLSANTTYYVRAYATNSVGTAYGSQISFTTSAAPADGQPCPSTDTVTDYDGNTYNTVQIGQQCWMKQNLRTTHYSDGTSISLGSSTSLTTAYRYYPNNDSSNVSTYGYLYNWPAVMQNSSSGSANSSGVQGICPTGWHVPSDAEWTQLTDYVSSQSQYVCGSNSTYIAKALASTTGWSTSSSTCAVGNTPSNNNVTGFSAVPAGYYDGSYNLFGSNACFRSATQYDSDNAYSRGLGYDSAYVYRNDRSKLNGFSVRCLRD